MEGSLILPLVLAIAALVLILAWMRIRSDGDRPRGAEPGQGHHVLTSDYQSGLGGHATTWRVPKDPQDYAKTFVPKGRDNRSKTP